MAKYVIDIEEENVIVDGRLHIPVEISLGKGTKKPVRVDIVLDNNVTPYAELEVYYEGFQAGSANTSLVITDNTIRERIEEAYQQGLEDAKNRKATCEFCEYAGNDESNEPCVSCCCGYMNRFRPKKEEIQIGDEVKFYNGEKCVVTVVENGQVLEVMDGDGFSMEMDDGLRNSMDKTGRHFNELGKLLQKMKEDDG